MDPSGPTMFVVDDEAGARESLAALATSMGVPCEAFPSAEECLQRLDPTRRGCLVIDLRLPGMDGLGLQERLPALGVAMPVIVVSAYADVRTTVRAMRNGALTVLEKPCQTDELADAVREALDAQGRAVTPDRRTAESRARFSALDERERTVMGMILEGVPNKTIARRLHVSHRTVDRIRAAVFEKMGVGSAVELAKMAEDRERPQP